MRFHSIRLATVIGLGSLCSSIAIAQPQSQPTALPSARSPANTPVQSRRVPANSESSELVTLNFPGGTVKEFIDVLRAAMDPMSLNVLIEPEAAKQPVPPVNMKDVSYYYVLRLLDRNIEDVQGGFTQLAIEQLNTPEGSAPIFKIVSRSQGRSSSIGFSVLSLNPIIGLPGSKGATASTLDAKTVLAAVEAAVAAADDERASPPTLKFHESSGLLFVRGTPAQQRAAEEVIRQLRKDLETASQAAQRGRGADGEKRLIIPPEHHDAILKALHQRFDGECCIQFVFEGDTLRITGDKVLLDEGAAIAFTRLLQLQGSPFEEQK